MSSSFKIKVVAAGWEPAKKEFFQRCGRNLRNFFRNCYITTGIEIKTLSYSNEYDDSLTMSIWNINSSQRFRFMAPTFFRGAAAYLLFYDISSPQSVKELEYWIQCTSSNTRQNPTFVIAYKSNLNDKINFEKINDFVEEYEIAGFYIISIRKLDRISRIFNEIVSRIAEYIFSYRVDKTKISEEEQKLYKKFILTYRRCPMCLSMNHKHNLNRIFFSTELRTRKFREKLVRLMNYSENFEDNYLNKIKIGIPCCSCHKKVFS